MTVSTTSRARAEETLAQMGPGLYRRAYEAGMSLSAYLEQQDPSEGYGDGLDAFERLLRVAGVRSVSRPELGAYASRGEAMLGATVPDHVRALFPEWAARMWRAGKTGMSASTRSLHSIADYAAGTIVNPAAQAAQSRATRMIAPAIPLAELIAVVSPVTGGAYEAFYLTDDADQQRMVRVAEGAEIPRAKLTGGDQTVRLRKYGRVLEVTYEFMRRASLDWLALHIQRMAAQVETDKVGAVLNVVVNGDGNAGTAATVSALTALDPAATAGTMTLRGWLAFKMLFANPYSLTAALAQDAVALQLMLLNAGSANIPAVTFGQSAGFALFRPINPGLADGTGLGWTAQAPALQIVAMDARFAVEQVTEVGATLQEVQRWTTQQVETLTLSEVEGYKIFDPAASHILNVNA